MKLHLNTFGSHEIQEHVARQVALDAWDAEGNQLSLSLYTHNMLTKPLHAPKISPEDKKFLRNNNISIELNGSGSFIKPLILLGCYQLWTLIKNNEPHIQLSSGLYLLPTTIGYLCTGKIIEINQMHQKKEENTLLKLQQKEEDEIEQHRREDDEDIDNWEDQWTLQGQVNTALIHRSEPDDNEEIDWEKF
ncbi:hypothetical protein KIN20_024867 [Parelaphostrongylus tenuis]|uniref:Uncharacterized protein n=1 Tax=Parelaphostrongylus tenuis TaxID=148309 RepID=A0AAD5MXK3_PARTN|nr:hypothetical protein KIN20_024867 [Parelaphostrongylus tenuis]